MNITRNNIDDLNALINITLERNDFEPKVEEVLKDYKKNASVPGFRKGHVPMSMIKKQYGDAILFEEVNKTLQTELSKYINEEKIEILGNPLPVAKDIDWKSDVLSFDFELGLSPKFDVDLQQIKGIKKYAITASEEQIKEEIENIQKHFGKMISKDTVEANFDVLVEVSNEEANIKNETTFNVSEIKEASQNIFLNKKVGDVVKVSSKDIFEDESKLTTLLKLPQENTNEIELNFNIKEINTKELAELNKELFDKTFGPDTASTEEEFKNKLKEEIEKNFQTQTKQKFSADVIDALIEETTVEMPKNFLIKWFQTAGEKPLSEEEAKAEYDKSEKGLKYQLIENKLVQDNNLNVGLEDIKGYIKTVISEQFAQYGRPEPSDEELDEIVKKASEDKDEMGRIVQQITSEKLEKLFEEKIAVEEKTVDTKEFMKEFYGA